MLDFNTAKQIANVVAKLTENGCGICFMEAADVLNNQWPEFVWSNECSQITVKERENNGSDQ
jgi:hypothetical protein